MGCQAVKGGESHLLCSSEHPTQAKSGKKCLLETAIKCVRGKEQGKVRHGLPCHCRGLVPLWLLKRVVCFKAQEDKISLYRFKYKFTIAASLCESSIENEGGFEWLYTIWTWTRAANCHLISIQGSTMALWITGKLNVCLQLLRSMQFSYLWLRWMHPFSRLSYAGEDDRSAHSYIFWLVGNFVPMTWWQRNWISWTILTNYINMIFIQVGVHLPCLRKIIANIWKRTIR